MWWVSKPSQRWPKVPVESVQFGGASHYVLLPNEGSMSNLDSTFGKLPDAPW